MAKLSKITITKALVTFLNVGMLALSCVYLKDLPRIVLLCAFILFASLGVIVPSINEKAHEAVYKFFVLASISAALLLIGYMALESSGWLYKFKDMDALLTMIRNTKQWGILVYIGIVIFQVIFLPIPSAIIAVIGTILYGPTYAFLFMTAGTLIGSAITFIMGKIFGRKLAVWVIGEEKTDKFAAMLNEKGKFIFIVTMLFPFFPDDIICLIAGITTMRFRYFITVVTFTRPVMIAFMCYFGSGSIIPFRGWGIPAWIAIFVGVIILFFIINAIKKRIMGDKSKNDTVKDTPWAPQREKKGKKA